MKFRLIGAFACAAAVATQVVAGTALLPQPFAVGDEHARFYKGVPTVLLEKDHGAVSVLPEAMDHGSLSFRIVVYNDGDTAADFDVANVSGTAGEVSLRAFTVDELQHAAKSRAAWSAVGMALLAGAAAYAASTAYTTNTSYGHLRTPGGTYHWASTYRDNSIGVLGAGAATAAGVVGVSRIQDRLMGTLDQLGDQVVQRTTVDPGDSYGGRVIMIKVPEKAGRDIRLNVSWNGEVYPFGFHIMKSGDVAPPPPPSATSSRIARAAAVPNAAQVIPAVVTTSAPVANPMTANGSVAPAAPIAQPVALAKASAN